MKKIITFALTLAMCSMAVIPSSAADTNIDQNSGPKTGNTSVSFNVNPAYIVTIPEKIELERTGDETVTYEKDLTVTAEAGMRLEKNQTVQVKLSSDFILESDEGATLGYSVTKADNNDVANDEVVTTFSTSTEKQTCTLHFKANDPQFAGDYSDTVTFTIAVSAAQTGAIIDSDWGEEVEIGF